MLSVELTPNSTLLIHNSINSSALPISSSACSLGTFSIYFSLRGSQALLFGFLDKKVTKNQVCLNLPITEIYILKVYKQFSIYFFLDKKVTKNQDCSKLPITET